MPCNTFDVQPLASISIRFPSDFQNRHKIDGTYGTKLVSKCFKILQNSWRRSEAWRRCGDRGWSRGSGSRGSGPLQVLLKIRQDPASGIQEDAGRCIVFHSVAYCCKILQDFASLSKTEILSRWCEAVQSQHSWARYGATWENMDFDRGHMKKAMMQNDA